MRKFLLTSLLLISALLTFGQHPTNLTSSNITSSSADLSWDASMCSGNVNFKYRITGSGSSGWIQTNNVTSPYILNNLLSITSYDWQVKCAGTNGWSSTDVFVTTSGGCNLISSISITDAACSNTMNGSVVLTISNGSPPYSFLWDNGDTTQNLTAVNAGTYIVQITDNAGCVLSDTAIIGVIGTQSLTQELTDFVPNPVTAYHQWSYDTLRITNTGCEVRIRPEFTVTCSAGPIQQGDIVIKWQHPLGWNQTINYNIDANGNASGYWSFTANDSTGTDITYGQIQDVVVQVKFVNPALYGDYTATWETFKVDAVGNKLGSLSPTNTVILSLVNCSNFSIDSVSSSNVTCNTGADGSATVLGVLNGSGNYSYLWSNGNANITATNLSAGAYSVTVTDDSWGCIDSSTVVITEPNLMNASLTGTHLSCNGSNDGTLIANGVGGSGQFDVIWVSHPFLPPLTNQTNLAAGTYIIDVIDLLCGDVSSATYTITEPSIVTINSTSSNNSSCDTAMCNGSISISLSGGTPPYSYVWTNGYVDSIRDDLCGNTYSINAMDINGCGNFTQNITIYDSASPSSASVIGTDISCYGAQDGSAEAIIGGGNNSGGNMSTLTYCNSGPGTSIYYSTIDLVRLVGDGDSIVNNTSGQCDSYEDYTSQYTSLTPGQSYSIDIDLGTCTPNQYFIDSAKVFVDWNIDGDFDDMYEVVGIFGGVQSPTSNTITFTVPNIAYGATRMRIVSQGQGSGSGSVSPCDVGTYGGTWNQPWFGSTEDYSIVISGVIPATYLWNTGDTTSTISNLSDGTYYCEVTDTNNCSATDTVTIIEPTIVNASISDSNDVSCNGGNDGSITVSASGGTPPFQYSLDNMTWQTSATFSGLIEGTYDIYVKDSNNCLDQIQSTITEPNPILATSTHTEPLCNAGNNGSITVSASGGTPPFQYSLDNIIWQTSATFNGLIAGTYDIYVKDSNNCPYPQNPLQQIITEPTIVNASISDSNDVSCNGGNDGSITVSASGGTPPYQYSLDNMTWQTSATFSGLIEGTYDIYVKDSNNCSDQIQVTIDEPNPLISTIATTNLTSCLVSNGALDLSVTGGTAPYQYLWNNNDTTEDLSNLSAGNYYVVITDNNNCTENDSANISQPSNNLNVTLVSSNYNGWEISCNAGNNGVIYADGSGGTGYLNYSYNGITTGDTITNLSQGTYHITVTDSIGCSFTNSIILTEPPILTSHIDSITNVLCNGDSTGSVTVTFSGGVSGTMPLDTNYILSWTNLNMALYYPNFTFNSANFVGVPAGVYPYSATDLNGCMHFDTVTITEPNSSISSTVTLSNYNGYNISCNGGNDGSITVSSSGGTLPHQYSIDGGITWSSSGIFNGLSAVTHTIDIKDNNDCSDQIQVIVTEPDALIVNLNSNNLSCYNSCDGGVTSQVYGGISSYTYLWNNGETNDSISSLCTGTYSVDVTDQNGCMTSSNSVYISEPSEIIITIDSVIDVSVYNGNDGSIYISPNGGSGNYSYSWSGPSGYSSVNDDILGLSYGDYIITVTDTANCFSSDTVYINQPTSLSVSLDTATNLLCYGECNGSLYITANGGDSVYTYLWIGPNGFTSTEEDIDSLCAGTYELTVSDTTISIYASFTITQPTQISIIMNADTILCYGDTSQASAYSYGGQSPYQTTWDNGSTSISTYLNAGIHYVNVTDADGCLASNSINVIQNDSIIMSTNHTNVSCFGLSDGSVDINVISGGLPPYIYSDDNGQNFQNTNAFINLSTGTYHYIVIDANGCTNSSSAIINEPPLLNVTINATNVSCYGECDGTATSNTSGGTGSYYEDWGGLDPDSLCSGLVNLIIQDDNGCLATSSVIITEPNPIIVSITANGNVLEASPGFVFYQWIDGNGIPILGATSQYFTPTSQGQYAVEVTTSDFCTQISEYIHFIIESIDEVNSKILAYPNPTNGWVTIEIQKNMDGDIRIINTFGEIILTINSNKLLDQKEMINLTDYSKGIYIIQLINNDTIINHRLILQ